MAFHSFDYVKAEEAEAMMRFKSLNFCFTAILAIISSASLLSPWMPSALDVTGDLFRRFVLLFHQPFYMFLLLNAIIFVISLSSGQWDQLNDLTFAMETVEYSKSQVRDEVITVEEPSVVAVSTVSEVKEEEKNCTGIQSESQVGDEVSTAEEPPVAVVSTVSEGKEEKSFTGNDSENGENSPRIIHCEQAESEMVIGEQAGNPMDELSNEEFRQTIETFIKAKKRTLFQESMAERKAHEDGLYHESWNYRRDFLLN